MVPKFVRCFRFFFHGRWADGKCRGMPEILALGAWRASERVSVVVFALRLRMSLTAPLAAPCGFCLTWVLREEF